MAAGDLQTEAPEGFTGAAAGFDKSTPPGGTTVLTTADAASYKAAAAAGGERIKVAAGLTFQATDKWHFVSRTQAYTPSGKHTLSPRGGHSGEFLDVSGDQDIFLGNFEIECDKGVDGSNNPGTAIAMFDLCNRIYLHFVGLLMDPGQSTFSDPSETLNVWVNSEVNNVEKLITLHGVYVPNPGFTPSKMATCGGSDEDRASNTLLSVIRGYSYAHHRSMFCSDGVKVHYMHFVLPDGVSRIVGTNINDPESAMDMEASYIGDSNAQFGEVAIVNGAALYLPTGTGTAVDNLISGDAEVDTPTSSSSVVGAYAGRPTPAVAMTTGLRNTILAETAGTYAITEETPPGTPPDPNSSEHNRWRGLAYAGGLYRVLRSSLQPYERAVFEAAPDLFKRRIGPGLFTFDRLSHYRGLWVPPRYVHQRQFHAVGGI